MWVFLEAKHMLGVHVHPKTLIDDVFFTPTFIEWSLGTGRFLVKCLLC